MQGRNGQGGEVHAEMDEIMRRRKPKFQEAMGIMCEWQCGARKRRENGGAERGRAGEREEERVKAGKGDTKVTRRKVRTGGRISERGQGKNMKSGRKLELSADGPLSVAWMAMQREGGRREGGRTDGEGQGRGARRREGISWGSRGAWEDGERKWKEEGTKEW